MASHWRYVNEVAPVGCRNLCMGNLTLDGDCVV